MFWLICLIIGCLKVMLAIEASFDDIILRKCQLHLFISQVLGLISQDDVVLLALASHGDVILLYARMATLYYYEGLRAMPG